MLYNIKPSAHKSTFCSFQSIRMPILKPKTSLKLARGLAVVLNWWLLQYVRHLFTRHRGSLCNGCYKYSREKSAPPHGGHPQSRSKSSTPGPIINLLLHLVIKIERPPCKRASEQEVCICNLNDKAANNTKRQKTIHRAVMCAGLLHAPQATVALLFRVAHMAQPKSQV